MFKQLALAAALTAAAASSQAATVLDEGFESVAAALGAGWVANNLSNPVGDHGWTQGSAVFDAQAGSATSYATTSFQATSLGGGTIDNWLITPTLAFGASNTLTFWTRTFSNPTSYPDRLEVLLSTSGSSTAPASFTTVLKWVNENLTATDYPNVWTAYTASFNVAAGTTGRIAFRYVLPNNSAYADVIGVDTVSVSAVPEAPTAATTLLGLAALGGWLRRRRA